MSLAAEPRRSKRNEEETKVEKKKPKSRAKRIVEDAEDRAKTERLSKESSAAAVIARSKSLAAAKTRKGKGKGTAAGGSSSIPVDTRRLTETYFR